MARNLNTRSRNANFDCAPSVIHRERIGDAWSGVHPWYQPIAKRIPGKQCLARQLRRQKHAAPYSKESPSVGDGLLIAPLVRPPRYAPSSPQWSPRIPGCPDFPALACYSRPERSFAPLSYNPTE